MADARNLPPAEDVSVVDDDLAINEDEREEIEREIDALVSRGGRESALAPEYLNPRRSGVGLPVLIWILAGAAFTAGFVFIANYFQIREESVALESRAYFTTEAQLIEEILRESEARLAEKDEEIGEIQNRLTRLDEEKQSLEENLEERVAERAAELRRELEAELDAERARLADTGRSQSEIDERIQALEAAREAEVAAQVDAFRDRAREELDELRDQLDAQEAQLQQTLAASREERVRLAEEANRREAELREEFGEEIAQLEDAERAALDRIEELQRLREEEQLLADRVLGSFTVIVEDIEEGLSDDALAGLASLERLLLDEGVGSGDRRRRRQTELALVTTLRSLVQDVDVLRENLAIRDLTATQDETEQLEQERAAELIRVAAQTVDLAERAREDRRYAEARSLYQQALSTIPSLDQVYPGILALESDRRDVAMRSALAEAQSLLAEGNPAEAVSRYLEGVRALAANEADPLVDVASGIATAVTATRRDLADAQDEIASGYETRIAAANARIDELTRSLAAANNAGAALDATVAAVRGELAAARDEVAGARRAVDDRDTRLAALRRETAALEDELASARTDLDAARSRAASLQQSLGSAQDRVTRLETESARLQNELARREAELERSAVDARARVAELETELAAAREELAQRPAATDVEETRSVETTAAEEAEALNRTIAEQERTIGQLEAAVADGRATVDELEAAAAETRAALAAARAESEELRADVGEAAVRMEALEERVASLQQGRELAAGETEDAVRELRTLRERAAELESLEREIDSLTSRYEQALAGAQQEIEDGDYDASRAQILRPFELASARRLFPGFVATLETAHRGVVDGAARSAAEEARTTAIDDVAGLATEVQRTIDAPRESIGVQSYLRREPDLAAVADEIFEIVELSARAISATEIEYKLLGSVSRVSTNLIVVERLVALEADVGDAIEIRRAPSLGQEVPIANGTILEVTEQRVVASVGEIYQLEDRPAGRDLVYIVQE